MALRCGIVGLPNVGKSTLFNALTAAGIAAENYPFCTIEPNSGVVVVPDARLAALDDDRALGAASCPPRSSSWTSRASCAARRKGEGLGNQFLAHIRETAAILHVVRCFEDPDVVHVDGARRSAARRRDDRDRARSSRTSTPWRSGSTACGARRAAGARKTRRRWPSSRRCSEHLSQGKPARSFPVPEAQADALRESFLLTAKPVLYVANVDEVGLTAGNEAVRRARAPRREDGRGRGAHLRQDRGRARGARARGEAGLPGGPRPRRARARTA